ncbi:hypothetical protein PIROE2DRAFT_19057 [Piromyces sp. E2]|nr:hypothetical protein PIROE2DRAFT_19057 [Piromyces sp. E2]|eukprot:OUM56360.1 hypothetical protein PIROE2DRAFT_19057 [Piromyces sp. E2]
MKFISLIVSSLFAVSAIAGPVNCKISDGKNASECANLNGKYFQKINVFPVCNTEYVCIVPRKNNESLDNCVAVKNKVYCSASNSNIDVCNPESSSYDFKQCTVEVSKKFKNFKYVPAVKPTATQKVAKRGHFKTKISFTLDENHTKTKIVIGPTDIPGFPFKKGKKN